MDVLIGIEVGSTDAAGYPDGMTPAAKSRLLEALAKAGFVMHTGPIPLERPESDEVKADSKDLFMVEVTQQLVFTSAIWARSGADAAVVLGDRVRAGEPGPFTSMKNVGIHDVRAQGAQEWVMSGTRMQRLLDRLVNIKRMHQPEPGSTTCNWCGVEAPCPTVRETDGDL